MTMICPSLRPVLVAAALVLAASAPVLAQGTPEEREACAPDAIKLCADTIPDVGRTTACMKRHQAELSPRCQRAFVAATGGGTEEAAPRDRRAARAAPQRAPRYAEEEAPRRTRRPPSSGLIEDDQIIVPPAPNDNVYVYRRDGEPVHPYRATNRDAARARGVLGGLCDAQLVGPATCAFTDRMITLSE